MRFHFTPLSLPPLATGAFVLLLAEWAWRRRPAPHVFAFVVFAFAVAEWSVTYAVALNIYDLVSRVAWAKVQYVGIALAPALWLVVILQNTGRARWLNPGRYLFLFLIPVIGMLLVFTNEAHGLIWETTAVDPSGGFSYFRVVYGPAFWGYLAYNYLQIVAGSLLLVQTVRRATGSYRAQALGLLISGLLPLAGNMVYVFRLIPPPSLELTVFAFGLSAAVMAWALYRHGLMDVVPVARDLVIERMADALIVLDDRHRVVDVNPAAVALLGKPAPDLIGRPAAEALILDGHALESADGGADGLREFGAPRGLRYFELRRNKLWDEQGRAIGMLISLRDVTAQRHTEEALRAAEQRAARLQTAAEIGATVGHELVQPLAVINGYIELMRARPRPPEQQARMLEEMHRAAAELTKRIRVIEGLRDYVTKSYTDGTTVVDLEKAEAGPHGGTTPPGDGSDQARSSFRAQN